MRRATIVLTGALLGVLALATASHVRSNVFAQSALADYTINWFTVNGGGAMSSSGGEYALSGTIGQPDAAAMSSGVYALNGGFWAGAEARYMVALPIVAR